MNAWQSYVIYRAALMYVVSYELWYEKIQATARAGAFVRAFEEHSTDSMLTWLTPGAEVKCSAHLKRLWFDVIVKTFCQLNCYFSFNIFFFLNQLLKVVFSLSD